MLHGAHHSFGLGEWVIGPISLPLSNIKISVPCSIRVLMEDIWDLNIYRCHHVYREANRTANCLAKKGIGIIDSRI